MKQGNDVVKLIFREDHLVWRMNGRVGTWTTL